MATELGLISRRIHATYKKTCISGHNSQATLGGDRHMYLVIAV